MGLDFLQQYGARRMRDFAPQPTLIGDGILLNESDEEVDRGYEVPPANWSPRDVSRTSARGDWQHKPRRFVDGKDVGRTIAWLKSPDGFPVPVRLSEIGAICLRSVPNINGETELRREWDQVERVVSFMADLFPWAEVEEFAIALQGSGFRLLPVSPQQFDAPLPDYGWDFERMRQSTIDRSKDEMIRLEREALAANFDVPTIVDGGLNERAAAFDSTDAVFGIIKSHARNYLHPQGWSTFYELEPCQRTPVFALETRNLRVVTWYVRMDGARGELPNWGVVRVEMPRNFFEQVLGQDYSQIDRLSNLICDCRCRDEFYSRAPVSIAPIVRAEESLGSLFTQTDTLVSRFYRLSQL